jgi:hypothetical protein
MSRESHSVHLLEKRLDRNCRDCLLLRVRSLEAQWRQKSHAGGYAVSDSSLVKLVLLSYLELKGVTNLNDPDDKFKTAFDVIGVKLPVEEIELQPMVQLPTVNIDPVLPPQGWLSLGESREKLEQPTVNASGVWDSLKERLNGLKQLFRLDKGLVQNRLK